MEKVALGRTGLEVSRMAFGAGPVGYLDSGQEEVTRILGTLLDAGVNLVDTAAAYLGSEEVVGRALGPRRASCVLLSKCGRRVPDVPGEDWSAGLVTGTVERSLRRLGTDHLDIMLLHSCSRQVLERGEALGALVRAREKGLVRFVGYSGDNDAAALAAALPEVDVLMCSVNLCDQVNLEEAVDLARKRGVGVVAKRSLANGAWKDPGEQSGIYRQYAEPYAERFRAMGLAAPEDGDWIGLALRFTLAMPGVHVASVGTTREAHARANLAAMAKGPLDAATCARIREAFRKAQAGAGQPWPGLT